MMMSLSFKAKLCKILLEKYNQKKKKKIVTKKFIFIKRKKKANTENFQRGKQVFN